LPKILALIIDCIRDVIYSIIIFVSNMVSHEIFSNEIWKSKIVKF